MTCSTFRSTQAISLIQNTNSENPKSQQHRSSANYRFFIAAFERVEILGGCPFNILKKSSITAKSGKEGYQTQLESLKLVTSCDGDVVG